MTEILYRQATIKDIDFVLKCIIEAEKSGSDKSPIQIMLDFDDERYNKLIRDILLEDDPRSEYCCQSFFLATSNNTPVGGLAAWIEGRSNKSSNVIKGGLLSYYAGFETWVKAQPLIEIFKEINPPRTPGCLLIESGYTIPKYNRKGIIQDLLKFAIDHHKQKHSNLKKAQVTSFIENIKSMNTLMKFGFSLVKNFQTDNPEIKSIIPGTGLAILELDI